MSAGTDTQPMLDEEQGASDNRLSLSLSTFPWARKLQQGQEYELQNVRVRVQTPGEFIVVNADLTSPEQQIERPYGEEGSKEVQGTVGGREDQPPMPMGGGQGGKTGNPAIDNLLAQGFGR